MVDLVVDKLFMNCKFTVVSAFVAIRRECYRK